MFYLKWNKYFGSVEFSLDVTAPGPTILIVHLEDLGMVAAVWADLIKALEAKANVGRVTSGKDAIDIINKTRNLRSVSVADAGIAKKKNMEVSKRISQYVREGGTVIFSGVFGSSISRPDFDRYFEERWSLPWKFGSYHRTTTHLNGSAAEKPHAGLPASYSQKAINVKGVKQADAWYLPGEDSKIKSNVFAAAPIAEKTETPVVFQNLGVGYVGYTGDVNAEEGTMAGCRPCSSSRDLSRHFPGRGRPREAVVMDTPR